MEFKLHIDQSYASVVEMPQLEKKFQRMLDELLVVVAARKIHQERERHATFEDMLQQLIDELIIKISANEIMGDLNETDLTNDPEWIKAREAAWEEVKGKYGFA